VAIIKLAECSNLPVLPIGDSDALEVGEWVMAIGNHFGFRLLELRKNKNHQELLP
jgi:S1-C subfamily serine protease